MKNFYRLFFAILIFTVSVAPSISAEEFDLLASNIPPEILKNVEADIQASGAILSTDKEGFGLHQNFQPMKQSAMAIIESKPLHYTRLMGVDASTATLAEITLDPSDSEWFAFAEQDGVWTSKVRYSNFQSGVYEYVGSCGSGEEFKEALLRFVDFMGDTKQLDSFIPLLLDYNNASWLVLSVDGTEYITYADYMLEVEGFTKTWQGDFGFNPYDIVPLSTFISGMQKMLASMQ